MKKVILYYKFTPLADPEMTKRWQLELCRRLHLQGRIIVSPQGINGTLGGDIENLREYKREMNRSGVFRGIAYKWSTGTGEDFPKLSVKVKPELVNFGAAQEIDIDENGIKGTGKHLKPDALHKLLKERDDVVFFDGRNAYEARVGKFKNAVVPDTETTRDFIREISSNKYNDIKKKPVVTYCTGGVRCEILSALMKNRGFEEVYQMDGGIVKYGEAFGDEGLWEGTLHIFDNRFRHNFTDETKIISHCDHCAKKSNVYVNCKNTDCNSRYIVCSNCSHKKTCPTCYKRVLTK